VNRKLRDVVASKLILDWSPAQISGWLKTKYPKHVRMRVSHETIYRTLFIQARGALKKKLMEHVRTKRRMRRSQHSRIWEGDLLSGSPNSHMVTLVERHSRFAMLIKVPSKDTAVVVRH
jgi:IS30 family transposase